MLTILCLNILLRQKGANMFCEWMHISSNSLYPRTDWLLLERMHLVKVRVYVTFMQVHLKRVDIISRFIPHKDIKASSSFM